MPSKALKNNLDFKDIPEELQGLNMQEERMIGLINCVTSIVKLGYYAGGQYGLKGGMAHLINDLPTQARVLPRSPKSTGIIFIQYNSDDKG